jgi:CRP-like cAMP-binding protein
MLVNMFQTGEWTAFSAAIINGPQLLSLVATRKSVVGLLPMDAVHRLFFGHTAHYRHLMRPALALLRYLYRYLIETNWRPPAQVVATRLFEMARHPSQPELAPRKFLDSLRQDDLAMATGLSRPTVNRVVQDLGARGIIELGYGKIHILDPQALLAFARDELS